MCVSHSALGSKLDLLDLDRVPVRASLQGCPTRDGVQTPKVSKPANTGGGDDDGVGGHRAARTPTASNGCTSTMTMHTGSFTTTTGHTGGPSGGRRCRSASVALSCGTPATASGATTSTSANNGGPGMPCRSQGRPSQTHRGTQGRGGEPVEQATHGNLSNTIAQLRPELA